jgi:hypothetical protein
MAASIDPSPTIQKGLQPVKYNLYGIYPLLRFGAEDGPYSVCSKSLNWRSCAAQWCIRLLCYVVPICTNTSYLNSAFADYIPQQRLQELLLWSTIGRHIAVILGISRLLSYKFFVVAPWSSQYLHILREIRGHFSNFQRS